MPRYMSRSLLIVLVTLALSGWGLAVNLGLRVIPAAGASPAEIAAAAGEYLTTRIALSGGSARPEQLAPLVTGDLAAALDALDGVVVPDKATLVGVPETETLWRVNERALVELRYLLSSSGSESAGGELVLMELVEGRWRASRAWTIAADDN
jgi:hypothetical protein